MADYRIQLKDKEGNRQFPVTTTQSIVDSEGRSLEEILANLGDGGVVTFYVAENFTDEIKAKNKAAYETYITAMGTKGVVFNIVDFGINLFPVASYLEGDVLLFEIITTFFSESGTIEALLLPCHPDGTVEA